MSQKVDKQSQYFRKWYAENKQRLSAARKERYRTDPELRARILARTAEWRKSKAQCPRDVGQKKQPMNGTLVEAYRITEAGKMIGRSDQTIRDWEEKKVIPKPTVERSHRYYTLNQIRLMRDLAEMIDSLRYEGRDVLSSATRGMSQEIYNNWNV